MQYFGGVLQCRQKVLFVRILLKTDVFWGWWGTRGTLRAPLVALLERGADFGRFFAAFWEALGDPFSL